MNKTIAITDVVYGRLKALKICDRDTFNDVLVRILDKQAGDE